MQQTQAKNSAVSEVIRLANPVFILVVVLVPVGTLVFALNGGSLKFLNWLHVMTGLLWTGIDIFMGGILGPALGGVSPAERAAVFRRLVPKMTFLMPVLAAVATTSGLGLARTLGWSLSNPLVMAALIITGILTVLGLGLLLPNEVRVFRQLLSPAPDIDRIARLGMINARLGGLQGLFQIAIIIVMVNIRF